METSAVYAAMDAAQIIWHTRDAPFFHYRLVFAIKQSWCYTSWWGFVLKRNECWTYLSEEKWFTEDSCTEQNVEKSARQFLAVKLKEKQIPAKEDSKEMRAYTHACIHWSKYLGHI